QARRQRAGIGDDERPGGPAPGLVDGAGRELLAGPGLAFEEHGAVAGRGALEEDEGRAHGDRAPDQRPEARRLRDRPARHGLGELEADAGRAEADRLAVAQAGVVDLDAVDPGAVRALEIDDAGPGRLHPDLAMKARHRRIGEDDAVPEVGADRAAVAVRDP